MNNIYIIRDNFIIDLHIFISIMLKSDINWSIIAKVMTFITKSTIKPDLQMFADL